LAGGVQQSKAATLFPGGRVRPAAGHADSESALVRYSIMNSSPRLILVRALGLTVLIAGAGSAFAQPAPAAPDQGASKPKLVVQLGHSGTVQAAAFSPDGSLVLTGGLDRTAILWEVSTGKKVRQFFGHSGAVSETAFAPQGDRIATSADGTVRVWDPASGKVLAEGKAETMRERGFATRWNPTVAERLRGLPDLKGKLLAPGCMACSEDGGRALVKVLWLGHPDQTQLWDVGAGKLVQDFDSGGLPVESVDLSPDGKQAAVGTGSSGGVLLFDVAGGKKVGTFKAYGSNSWGVRFTRDGKQLLIWTEAVLQLWDAASGKRVRNFESAVLPVTEVCRPADGRQLVAEFGWMQRFRWDLAAGRGDRAPLSAPRDPGLPFDYDPARDRLAVPDVGGRAVRILGLPARTELGVLDPRASGPPASAAFSPDGKWVLTADDKTVRLWDGQSFKPAGEKEHLVPNGPASSFVHYPKLTFARDSKRFLVYAKDAAAVWTVDPLRETARLEGFKGYLYCADWSADGDVLGTAGLGGGGEDYRKVRLWDGKTGKPLRDLKATDNTLVNFAFGADDKYVVTGDQAGAVVLWDLATGESVRSFPGHWGNVSVALSPDSRWLFSGGQDGTLRVWSVDDGKLRATLVHFQDGGWAVFDPEGRFDSNDLDAINGIHWVVPDDPYRPLPPEIFMRDYYEPRLLSRILAGETFKPVRSLASLNRVQPSVEITKVEPRPDRPDEATVTVEVAGRSATLTRDGKPVTIDSGVFDLQLFRDGRLVGWRPEKEGPVALDPKSGRATLRFEHVQLAGKAGSEVEFSAYAFNVDRVKSPTHRLTYHLPADLAGRKGTAYLICAGVNAFDRPEWDLNFAAADARATDHALREALSHSGKYERVAAVTLISEARTDGGKRTLLENTATKANLRAALALLAGRPVSDEDRRRLPGADALHKARPEDLVLLAFSTHGYNDADGQFYLFPADVGAARGADLDEETLRRAVSTDELTVWLRDVDAGEMVMIIDACHSAASVDQEGFKPGPMGSRGLGQLAYSKRMRVLAASQAADVALEDPQIGHGLLSYALCEDGLKRGRADFQPRDRRITMAEWLRYGARRVPELADEVAAGKVRAFSSTGRDLTRTEPEEKGVTRRDDRVRQRRLAAQQPSLFDFTRGDEGVVLQEQK